MKMVTMTFRVFAAFVFGALAMLSILAGLSTLIAIPLLWVGQVDNWYPYTRSGWITLLAFGPVMFYIVVVFVATAVITERALKDPTKTRTTPC